MTYIHSWTVPSNGFQPTGPLLQASDGNFYGATVAGGANQCLSGPFCGTVFRLTPSGQLTVLYSFGASASDGYSPNALIQGTDGALYGTTSSGGAFGAGTVFRITLNGVYTVLYSFNTKPGDGVRPSAALIQASDGNFYGVTGSGGANHCPQVSQSGGNCGTVFKMTPSGVTTVLHSFGASVADGFTPTGSLIQGSDGNLYGTTTNGGANDCGTSFGKNNCGTVFRITPGGALTVIHSFGSSPTDGVAPQGPLIQASDGAFYGTTSSGGGKCSFPGCGTVFRVTPGGQVTIVYAFGPALLDGHGPSPFLVQAKDGNFYGTTRSGGAFGGSSVGTVFRVTPSGQKTTLYSFGPMFEAPTDPAGGVIQGSDGAFYGITASGNGNVFKLVVN